MRRYSPPRGTETSYRVEGERKAKEAMDGILGLERRAEVFVGM